MNKEEKRKERGEGEGRGLFYLYIHRNSSDRVNLAIIGFNLIRWLRTVSEYIFNEQLQREMVEGE